MAGGRTWSLAEEDSLIKLWLDGESLHNIASTLDRTAAAYRTRVTQLGIGRRKILEYRE